MDDGADTATSPADDAQASPGDGEPAGDEEPSSATTLEPGEEGGAGLAVSYEVPLITQPDEMTCWAASLAMIQSYREQASFGVDDFAGPPPHHWMRWSQIEPIAVHLGFVEVAPADWTAEGWQQLLVTHGPLWIVVKSAVSNATSHAVVLVGLVGDGSLDATQLTVNNPIGSVDTQTFADFTARWDFGAVAGASIFAPQ